MRSAICLASFLVLAGAFLAGCGYIGEPKTPAMKRPEKVTNLEAVEQGSKIEIRFTLPSQTTEGLPLVEPPDVELRIGATPPTWNQADWEAHSERIPVPMDPWPQMSLKTPRGKKTRSTAHGKAAKTAKQAVATAKAATLAELTRTIDLDASKYAGKTVAIGIRVRGPSGRDAGWSQLVSLEVQPVLPVPQNLKASDAPNGVHLKWTATAPAFRIFRKQPDDSDWAHLGDSTQPSFDDKTADYGKTWQYYVVSARQTGDHWQESDQSEKISWTPKDIFPPAVPAGLTMIAGTKTIELVWDRVADADVAGYRVYRDGKMIADKLQTTAYSDKDVAAGKKYSYQISAVDLAGNESAKCAAQEITME